jgi:hypothetical protein
VVSFGGPFALFLSSRSANFTSRGFRFLAYRMPREIHTTRARKAILSKGFRKRDRQKEREREREREREKVKLADTRVAFAIVSS